MSAPFYAMDTNFFHSLGDYGFEARCEILADLGYGGLSLTLWNEPAWRDLSHVAAVRQSYGIDVVSLWVTLKLGTGDAGRENNERVLRLLETVEGTATIELAVWAGGTPAPVSRQHDDELRGWLERYLVIAGKRHIELLLYPHVAFYIERIEQAADWCRKINHPSLGLSFCGYHWYALDDPRLLDKRLADARPFLRGANICGSRKPGRNGMPATIEPLDAGELDNFAVLAALQRIDYHGPVGLQGYGVGGDVYLNLKRSFAAYHSMRHRLSRHGHWGTLRAED